MADVRKPDESAEETVKVVDRRRFTAEGDVRPDAPAAEVRETPPPPQPTSAPRETRSGAGQQAEKAYESRRPAHESKMDFRTLALSLSTTAMYQLGLVAEPGSPAPPPDLEAARQSIDMLAALEEKTRNNLTPEEKRLLEQALYELRMAYVSLAPK